MNIEHDIPTRPGDRMRLPVAPGALIRAGGLVRLTDAGEAAPADGGDGLVLGWAEATADNRRGRCREVTVRLGVGLFGNSPMDPLDASHVGGPAWFADERTAAASGEAYGGTVFAVDDAGVWIDFRQPRRPGAGEGEDTYSREEIDRKLAEAATGGTVDLDAYATDAEVDAAIAAAMDHAMRPITEAEIDDIIYGG